MPAAPASIRSAAHRGLLRRGGAVIWRMLTGAPRPFAVGIAGSALFAAMTVSASLVLRWVTDEVLLPIFEAGQIDRGLTLAAVAAIVGVGLLKALGVFGRRIGAFVAQYSLQSRYRREVSHRYLELPIAWHRRHPTGELLSNANSDVESAAFVAAPLPMAIGATLLLIVTGVLLVVTDPLLAAIGFSVGPLLGFANWYYQRRMRHAAMVAQEARADVSESAHESFDAALVVKAMGRETAETRRFQAISDDLRDRMIRVGRLRAFFDPVIEALPNVGILLVLAGGALRVRDGALSPGDLVLFAYLFRLAAMPMRVFGWLLGELPRAVVGWERIERVLTATGGMAYGDEPVGSGDGGAAAVADRVAYHHPASTREGLSDLTGDGRSQPPGQHAAADGDGEAATRGVQAITFDVDAGRTVALVGPTGSGKSTVAALMVRLFDPDAGEIRLDGRALPQLARDKLASEVAIVFQDAFLFDDTVGENITLGADFGPDEVVSAARLAQAHGFVSALPEGYDTIVGERGSTLSGGQRQRIALARALIRTPRLLVLDDATSAVDPAVEADILRGLAAADLPTTVIVIAYRRRSIELADEVVVVQGGRVVARGEHRALMRDVAAYRRLITAYDRESMTSPHPSRLERQERS